MKTIHVVIIICAIFCLSITAIGTVSADIIDHRHTDITAIPESAINQAKTDLHIMYGHTSHGSQPISGMNGLVGFANGGGLNLSLPTDIFAFNDGGTGGALDLREGDGYGEGDMDHDAGYYDNWVTETRSYLGTPDPQTGRGTNNPEINVIMWSWCGQAAIKTEATMINEYLSPMTQLEADYPGITFVYMTGHANGSGETGNLHIRNQQIKQYCIDNNKMLYDFYDIEIWDPDGNYYGDLDVQEDCDYNGGNWATEWQNLHTEDEDWYSCSPSHASSAHVMGNLKAYAAWFLWARIAGWGGGGVGGGDSTTDTTTEDTGGGGGGGCFIEQLF